MEPKETSKPSNYLAKTERGQYRKSLESYERDAEACKLYVAGKTYQQISDTLGYGSKGHAHTAVRRVLLETIKEPAEEVRALLRARNEEIYVLAREVALRDHYAHSNGKIIYDQNFKPVFDDMPKLSAMDRMHRSSVEIAKLTGVYSPQKFENLTLDVVQAEIARLEQEAREAGELE